MVSNKSEQSYAQEYQVELQNEIVARVTEMECDDYDFGKKFSKGDYIVAISIAVVSLILLIIGEYC